MALAPTNNVVVSATRFNVDYQLKGSNGAVTDTQFATVQNVTLQYLKDYLVKQFGFSIGTTLLDVVGTTVGHDNNKPQAIYDVKLVFSHDSISIPMQASVDVLVLSALNQPFVKDLIALLDALPSDNPFSTTSAVTYTPV